MYSHFIENVLGADLADIQIISKFNKEVLFYYALLLFPVNTHGLFLGKIKMVFQLLILFKNF